MKTSTIDIQARIEVLPFNMTGRPLGKNMKIDSYFPIFKFDSQLNDVFLSHKSKKYLKSEDKTEIGLSFKFPSQQIGRLSINDEFELTEGSRTIALGKITEVFNHVLSKKAWESKLSKSIEQLENDVWIKPNEYQTTLIEICHQLRKKKLASLSNEQLRLTISQELGILFTIPIVIKKLFEDKFIECDFYPGDLLQATFRKLKIDWAESEFLKEEITAFIRNRFSEIKAHDEIPEKAKREIFDNLVKYENTRDNKVR